jgi:hypothetical protein
MDSAIKLLNALGSTGGSASGALQVRQHVSDPFAGIKMWMEDPRRVPQVARFVSTGPVLVNATYRGAAIDLGAQDRNPQPPADP